MSIRLIPIKYELIHQPILPGTLVEEVPDFTKSRFYHRRLETLVTRRGFVLGAASAAIPMHFNSREAEAQGIGALIAVGIAFVQLASNSWDLYQKISGQIGLNNAKDDKRSGAVNQMVRNELFVESSSKIIVEVPASLAVTVGFVGPASKSKDANRFISETALARKAVIISIK